MSVHRSGPTPPYFEYLTSKALIPETEAPSKALLDVVTGEFSWVEVPRFQRGISWTTENVEELLQSDSVLLGNVILGSFSRSGKFPLIPDRFPTYTVLVDGLQRFAVGTILLSLLHPLVLTSQPSRPDIAEYFHGVKARVEPLSPIYLHNDASFSSHPRNAIKDQYMQLRKTLNLWLSDRLQQGNAKTFAQEVRKTMLDKQIAVDTYFNFSGPLELMNTFLGLNTVRVDLGPVDLLRATLVERASSANWQAEEIEDMENEFTEAFTEEERPKSELLPFVSIVLNALPVRGTAVFPSWDSGFTKAEADDFLEFTIAMEKSAGNGYLDEVRASGSLPFAAILTYYYTRFIKTRRRPSFLTNGNQENAELHEFLLATYRVLLDGRIARTRAFAEKCIAGNVESLATVAQEMSLQFLNVSTTASLTKDWLYSAFYNIDKDKAKRIFNAMLLPERALGMAASAFVPLKFGRHTSDFHIDHLIPDKSLEKTKPGGPEGYSLRNLAPLPSNQNRTAKDTPCSSKLGPNGIYQTYLASGTHAAHPYCHWLVMEHAPNYPLKLDKQEFLEANRDPAIGTARLEFICNHLLARL